jgi:hypothetical protein
MAALAISMIVKVRDSEPRKATAIPADLVAFEREFSKSITSLQDNVFLTDLLWLAWHAERRTNATGLDFDPWVETVETVETLDEAELVPLENRASTGSSVN